VTALGLVLFRLHLPLLLRGPSSKATRSLIASSLHRNKHMEQFIPNHLICCLLIDTLCPVVLVAAYRRRYEKRNMYISTSGYTVFRMSVQEARTTTIVIALVVIGEGKVTQRRIVGEFQRRGKFTREQVSGIVLGRENVWSWLSTNVHPILTFISKPITPPPRPSHPASTARQTGQYAFSASCCRPESRARVRAARTDPNRHEPHMICPQGVNVASFGAQ